MADVIVTNVGRAAIMVNEVGVSYFDLPEQGRPQQFLGQAKDRKSTDGEFPKRLEPGEEFPTAFDIGSMCANPEYPFVDVMASRDKIELRGYARVGRETLYAPGSIALNLADLRDDT